MLSATSAVVYGTPQETAVQRYARATFLLGWDGKAASTLTYDPDGPPDSFLPDWTRDIGKPSGARAAVGVGWRRPFAAGMVIVNPSASSSQPFSLGAVYRDHDGVCRSTMTLAPATATVLTKSC